MRLIRYEKDGEFRIGVKVGNEIAPTDYEDMIDFIHGGNDSIEQARRAAKESTRVTDYRLLAPITSPGKVLCSGINYKNHKEENPNAVLPKKPSFFSKLPSSIIGPGENIVIPYSESLTDYEVELTVIIGKTAKGVSKANALDYVFGYTIMNDVSGRDLQFELQHETIGKGIDSFCPIGPEIVLTDEITDPSELNVSSYVNGELRQSSPTSQMIFDVPTLIEYLSTYITLNPGDVISTGTPAGVGVFRNPPTYLKPGDIVEVGVDEIGKLSNLVVAGW